MLTYNLLAGGMLTGKHSRDLPPDASSRFASTGAADLYRERYWHDASFAAVDRLTVLAADLGLSLPTLAAAWVLSRRAVTSVVMGATRVEQLDLPLAALSIELDESTLRAIDEETSVFRQGDAVQ